MTSITLNLPKKKFKGKLPFNLCTHHKLLQTKSKDSWPIASTRSILAHFHVALVSFFLRLLHKLWYAFKTVERNIPCFRLFLETMQSRFSIFRIRWEAYDFEGKTFGRNVKLSSQFVPKFQLMKIHDLNGALLPTNPMWMTAHFLIG